MHWSGNVGGVKSVNHFQSKATVGSNNAEANMFTPGYAPATPPQVSWEQIQSVDMADVDKAYNKNFIEGRTRTIDQDIRNRRINKDQAQQHDSERLVLLVRINGVQLHKDDA